MRGALVLGLALLAPAAAAQQTPLMVATRDVVVTYRGIGAGDAPAVAPSVAWLGSRRALRMDMPGLGWSVAEHGATPPTGFIVLEEQRRIMEMPPNVLRRQLGATPDARFTREGTDRIAGHACTLWRFESQDGEGQLCMTADGVMLRSLGKIQGQTMGVEATQVAYTAQDPSRFQRPTGYEPLQQRQPRQR